MNYIKIQLRWNLAMSFNDDLALNRFDLKLKKVSSFKGLLLRLLEVMDNSFKEYCSQVILHFLLMKDIDFYMRDHLK